MVQFEKQNSYKARMAQQTRTPPQMVGQCLVKLNLIGPKAHCERLGTASWNGEIHLLEDLYLASRLASVRFQ